MRRWSFVRGGDRPPERGVGWRAGPFRALPTLLLAVALGGCAGALPPEAPVASIPPKPAVAPEPATPADREHARILAAYGGAYKSPRLEALIEGTVTKLVAVSERPDLRYRVTILNSPAINAFALPTGQLYVTRGLLALANDDAELASVLAHEMSHVVARHAATREDQVRQAAIVNRVVTDVLNDPELGALALAKSKIALANFSRAQELEADAIGVGMTARAGFDPFGATRFLSAMGRNAELKPSAPAGAEPRSVDFLSSHPSTPDRVKNATAHARQYSAPGSGTRNKAAYLAATDGLAYGDDPNDGLVRGRRFLHPKLGFTFTAPPGFALDNTAQAVLGVKDGGAQAMRVDVVRVPAEQSLSDYVLSGWIEKVDPRSVESFAINGLPAATGTANGGEWSFRIYVVRFGSDVYRVVYAAKPKLGDADAAFRESIGTFRRMTLPEIDRARPLRLQLVTVQPGDTVQSLAARMASEDYALQRFLVLNGLTEKDPLTPGEQVKIVVE